MDNQVFRWPRFVQCFRYFLRRDSLIPYVLAPGFVWLACRQFRKAEV